MCEEKFCDVCDDEVPEEDDFSLDHANTVCHGCYNAFEDGSLVYDEKTKSYIPCEDLKGKSNG